MTEAIEKFLQKSPALQKLCIITVWENQRAAGASVFLNRDVMEIPGASSAAWELSRLVRSEVLSASNNTPSTPPALTVKAIRKAADTQRRKPRQKTPNSKTHARHRAMGS